jgi:hypothetical protein
MRALCVGLAAMRFAQDLHMTKRFHDRGLQIGEIDRLCQKIERTAIHRGPYTAHVAIGRDDDRRFPVVSLLQFLK